MSIDHSKHSLFGVSKVAADVLVQEYGRYFGMPTVCLRGGCLTGPAHAGTELHGFLSYLMKCTITGSPTRSSATAASRSATTSTAPTSSSACLAFHAAREPGAVYNMGGGRDANCSMLEAIEALRANRRQADQLDALRRGADRRPSLVHQRPRRVPGRLPGLGAGPRRRLDPARDT